MADSLIRAQDIENSAISNIHINASAGITSSKIDTSGSANLVSQIVAGTNIAISGGDGIGHGAVTVTAVNMSVMEFREEFIATPGQTVFALATGTYYLGGKNIKVFVGGALKLFTTHYTEFSTSQVLFGTPMSGGELVSFFWAKGTGSTSSDLVDGFHASATAVANSILPLDGSANLDLQQQQLKNTVIHNCTSVTQPPTPVAGQIIFETDTGLLKVWFNATWSLVASVPNNAITPIKTNLNPHRFAQLTTTPQNIRSYIPQTVQFNATPNSSVMCCDGKLAYVFHGTNNLYVINVETMAVVNTVAIGWIMGATKPIIIGGFIYTVFASKIRKISLADYSYTESAVDTNLAGCFYIVSDGTSFFYLACSNGGLYTVQKWNLGALTKVSESGAMSAPFTNSQFYCYDGYYLYMAEVVRTGGYKVKKFDTISMTETATFTGARDMLHGMVYDGNYIYLFDYIGGSTPLFVEQVNPLSFTQVATWSIGTTYADVIYPVIFDGRYIYAHVMLGGGVMKICKYDVTSPSVMVGSADYFYSGSVQGVEFDGVHLLIVTSTNLYRRAIRSLIDCPATY